MKSVVRWLDEYSMAHKNPTNQTVHWICVPLIYWSVYAALASIPVPSWFVVGDFVVHYGLIAIVLIQLYYFALSFRLGLAMLIFNVLMVLATNLLVSVLPLPLWQVAIAVFVLAWIGQFIGHNIEGSRPSFFKDLLFLLIGPLWLMSKLMRRFGLWPAPAHGQ